MTSAPRLPPRWVWSRNQLLATTKTISPALSLADPASISTRVPGRSPFQSHFVDHRSYDDGGPPLAIYGQRSTVHGPRSTACEPWNTENCNDIRSPDGI